MFNDGINKNFMNILKYGKSHKMLQEKYIKNLYIAVYNVVVLNAVFEFFAKAND